MSGFKSKTYNVCQLAQKFLSEKNQILSQKILHVVKVSSVYRNCEKVCGKN